MSLVTTGWLADRSSDPSIRICDVRWYLAGSGRSGRAEYEKAHIPGAVFVDLDIDLAGPDDGRAGRHPLPAPEAFAAAMGRLGIDGTVHVVAYDDAGGAAAARLWWLLRAHGHEQVSLLDGGWSAWLAEGRPTDPAPVTQVPRRFESRPVLRAALDLDGVRAAVRGGALLLDARAPERYRGETEPIDPRAGHIPGALNAPLAKNLEPDGRFLQPGELAVYYRGLGADRLAVVASCGSGVTACHTLFALDHSGVAPFPSARLYAGSFSEWSRRTELPVATGEDPGEPC